MKKNTKQKPKHIAKKLEDGYLSNLIIGYAFDLARKIDAKAIFINCGAIPDMCVLNENKEPFDIYLIAKDDEGITKANKIAHNVLKVPDIPLSRTGQIKIAVMMAVSKNLLKQGDRIVCLSGVPKFDTLDTIMMMEVGKESEIVTSTEISGFTREVNTEVFDTLIRLAVEIANEGREGKPVGTTFVLGDTAIVKAHIRQLILNPFKGYPEKKRQILDPRIRETIKEFSSIDGAFIIRRDGVIETAGAFLETQLLAEDLPQGLGARHYSAAAITTATKAIAITISESTGTVRIFKRGKIIMEIEKPVKERQSTS